MTSCINVVFSLKETIHTLHFQLRVIERQVMFMQD